MPYTIPLTEAGKALYASRDQNAEKAVIFLVNRMGADHWARRKNALINRFAARLHPDPRTTPVEGVSIRDREDEIAWYLYLAETSISNPPVCDSDQTSRLLPYISAFGRKLDAILAIDGIDERIAKLLRQINGQDPDQALFELLVGASYVEEGWAVCAIHETPGTKSPDFEIKRALRRFEVECKRFTRRSDYTTRERDAWLRLWAPVGQWLVQEELQLIFTVEFGVELTSLPASYLFDIVRRSQRQVDAIFRPAQALYKFADATPRALGIYALTEKHALRCRIVLLRRPPKQRHQSLRRSSGRARGGKASKMARAAREPWLLAHSETLSSYSPAQITHWYALRMQIESSFRDLKSHRFGCAFEDTLTRSAERLEVLLLIHMLATLAAWLAALAAIALHEYRFRISLLRRGWESLHSGSRRIESPLHALSKLWRLADQSACAP